MPRRKGSPPVVRPTGGRRLVELGKDLLIVALVISALFLTAQTPMATQLRGWVSPPVRQTEPIDRLPREAVEPYGIAVRNSRGLYAAIYDAGQVDRAFEQISPLLGEGLATAGTPERISRSQWQTLLEEPGICCVFQGKPSLRVLAAWVGRETAPEGQARSLLLVRDGGEVWLCWREESSFYRCSTQVGYGGSMEPLLEEFSPNGAAYAYTLAETDRAYETLEPDVLIPMTTPQLKAYASSAPDLVGNREELEKLLAALGFQSGVGSAYEAGGGLAINESGDRLRVSGHGTVAFHSAEEEARYPVSPQGEGLSAEEATTAAWELLNQATAPWKGESTTFVLTGVEETEEGWTVTFHSRLDGIPVLTGAEGWSASFVLTKGRVSDFTLALRSYAATGETLLLPGQRLAAAALGSETYQDSGRRLTLCYSDLGGNTLAAGWVAED